MNNPFGVTEPSFRRLIKVLATKPQVEEAIIFGSRAKGNYKKGSDIDLAIKGKNCSEALALDLKATFNEELPIPYMVDVVDYGSLQNRELKAHIDRVGLVFYQK